MIETITRTITAADEIRMNIPPTFIGANIFFKSCDMSELVLLDDTMPPIDMLAAEDITELYIAVMDVKKQPTNPNIEQTAVTIESVFSRDRVTISITAQIKATRNAANPPNLARSSRG